MPGIFSLAPNVAVAWLNAPVTIEDLVYGDHHREACLAVNPKGQVLAISRDDGAILGYIGATCGADSDARDTRLVRKKA